MRKSNLSHFNSNLNLYNKFQISFLCESNEDQTSNPSSLLNSNRSMISDSNKSLSSTISNSYPQSLSKDYEKNSYDNLAVKEKEKSKKFDQQNRYVTMKGKILICFYDS